MWSDFKPVNLKLSFPTQMFFFEPRTYLVGYPNLFFGIVIKHPQLIQSAFKNIVLILPLLKLRLSKKKKKRGRISGKEKYPPSNFNFSILNTFQICAIPKISSNFLGILGIGNLRSRAAQVNESYSPPFLRTFCFFFCFLCRYISAQI